jgi:hypothetical protein
MGLLRTLSGTVRSVAMAQFLIGTHAVPIVLTKEMVAAEPRVLATIVITVHRAPGKMVLRRPVGIVGTAVMARCRTGTRFAQTAVTREMVDATRTV